MSRLSTNIVSDAGVGLRGVSVIPMSTLTQSLGATGCEMKPMRCSCAIVNQPTERAVQYRAAHNCAMERSGPILLRCNPH